LSNDLDQSKAFTTRRWRR